MYIEIIKNPIFLGILSGLVTYLYLLWDQNQKNLRRSKQGKNKRFTQKNINLLIPVVVSLVVCILSYSYFYMSNNISIPIDLEQNIKCNMQNLNAQQLINSVPVLEKQSHSTHVIPQFNISNDSPSFNLISKELNIPTKALKMPNVWIETF